MQVRLDRITTTPNSLRVGLIVEYQKDGPIRFAQLVVEDDALEWPQVVALVDWAHRQVNRHLDRERDLDHEVPLPGL